MTEKQDCNDYFLEQVADYYINNYSINKSQGNEQGTDLSDYTFVFPSRRGAMFMSKYLKRKYKSTGFLPNMISITKFIQDFAKTELVHDDELIFILFKAYKRVMAKHGKEDQARSFDEFVHWGNILLQDFNDVDAYMVDHRQLFKNVHDYNSIESNYLTAEQIEVAKILGDKRNLSADMNNFWKHANSDKDRPAAEKFLSLWEVLDEVYDEFQRDLKQKRMAYSGLQSKQAAEAIKGMSKDDFRDRRFAFIGFYVLSTSRTMIFKHLQKLGIADFFWDVSSPRLNEDGNRAGSMVMPLSETFKKPAGFTLKAIDAKPKIDVYPIPSNIAQAKVAISVLEQWYAQDVAAQKPDADKLGTEVTAIVVPDDQLLQPLLYTLPERLDDDSEPFTINVATSVDYSQTPFASLINAILVLQEHSRKYKDSFHFYYKDVMEVLSHPYIASFYHKSAEKAKREIAKGHIFNIKEEDIREWAPDLAFIFTAIGDTGDVDVATEYFDQLLGGFEKIVNLAPKPKKEDQNQQAGQNEDKEEVRSPYEAEILESYRGTIDKILKLADKYNIEMNDRTFFSMLRKMLALTKVQFKGDPVEGLQILGMQDTRCLDFDNLIILSLNERILPRKSVTSSFIPPLLRRGYQMPTDDNADIAASYQFYRLISRAKRIAMIYDSRTPDLSQGEKSRYITQIELLNHDNITIHKVKMGADPGNGRKITIEKDATVMKQVRRLLEGGDLNISASSLKNFIQCPLKFYLQNVRGINTEEQNLDYMDAASYGQVLHKVAENFYNEFKSEDDKKAFIPIATLRDYFSSPQKEKQLKKRLTLLALEAMNQLYYNKKYTDDLDSIPGEGQVLAKIIAKYIKAMIKAESQGTDFTYVAGEYRLGQKRHVWEITPELRINFTMSIDRVDQLDDAGQQLRFIDYKTGSDMLAAPSVEALFTDHEYAAIFQLMIYALAYHELTGTDPSIKPVIYKMTEIPKLGIKSLTIGEGRGNKREINDYRQLDGDLACSLRNEVKERFTDLIQRIFDENEPFSQTEDKKNCKYCQFINICGRALETESTEETEKK